MSRHLGVQCGLCVLMAIFAVAPWLGSGGLNASEGLRVAAGLDLVTRSDTQASWLTQTIFEQPYLRKPPGIAWSIALMHEVFGFSQWAFRLPSAISHILLTLLAFVFAHRVITARDQQSEAGAHSLAPFSAGAAAALSPLMWEFARAAEIEAMTIFTGALACAGLMAHALVRSRREALIWLILAIVGTTGTILLKGPATLPVIFACLLACSIVPAVMFKGERAMIKAAGIRTGMWPFAQQFLAIALGSMAAILILMQVAAATGSDSAVTQSPGEFLWAADRVQGIITLPITALATMLPASLTLIWLLCVRVLARPMPPEDLREVFIARLVIFAAIASLVIFAIAGISNPRYAAPAWWPVLLLIPVAIRRYESLKSAASRRSTSAAESHGHIELRVLQFLGFSRNCAIVLLIACLIAAPIYAYLTNQSRVKNSGLTGALALAPSVTESGMIFADDAIEARAEVLLYLRQITAERSPAVTLRPIWIPSLEGDAIKRRIDGGASGTHYLLLRTDGRSSEKAAFQQQHPAWRLTPLATAQVHVFGFELFRIDEAP